MKKLDEIFLYSTANKDEEMWSKEGYNPGRPHQKNWSDSFSNANARPVKQEVEKNKGKKLAVQGVFMAQW